MDAILTPWIFVSIALLIFSSKTHLCNTADDIMLVGQSITANLTIVSKGGTFELGFFTPGKSLNYYIGIWYKKVSVQDRTVVWVANREQPIKINELSSSEFKLLENGNLVLFSQSKISVWSTNSSSNTLNSPAVVVLGDDGNLVVRDGSNPSVVIWQSFDYPSDTWLPGGKLRYDNHTKKSQKLTSWKNSEDPTPGIFSLELQPNGEYVMKWNISQQYWSSGVWNGETFSSLPVVRVKYIYNISYISNENESYFTYSPYNKSLLCRLSLDFSGQAKNLVWSDGTQKWSLIWSQPIHQCDVYGFCGAFGICNENGFPFCQCLPGFEEHSSIDWDLLDVHSGGCVRKASLKCGEKDKFSKMSNVRLPINSESLAIGSDEECKIACLNNCSCSGCAYRATRCLIWYGDLLNIQQLDSGGDDFFLRIVASEVLQNSDTKASTVWAILGPILGIIALVAAFILLFICHGWRMKISNLGTPVIVQEDPFVPTFLTVFQYKDLKIATKNFSEKLGGGGFGCVFKGKLPDQTVVAVKKLESINQGEKQFRSEVHTIGLIQHTNLIRLRGFCSEATKRMLVYNFMPNGSLDSYLHPNDSKILNWNIRYRIALGTARALAYLHEECRDCIIHCDIKPENILLDADFCPKVADFGLAKLLGREFSRVVTTMRGTIGYLAPEWASGVAITAKADVYSYGMMLFEIISGRRNLKQSKDGLKACFFPAWAAIKVSKGYEVLNLLDRMLEGNADIEELTRTLKVACWCIQEEGVQRPSMGRVVQILEGLLEVDYPPIPNYLQVLVENDEGIDFFSESSNPNGLLQTQ